MDTLNAKPWLLKQANLSLIRKVIKNKGTVTKAEIAEETKISSTTVRSLLIEMLQSGEIESIGYDKSSGGRKAELYRFQPNRYHSVAFCMNSNQLHALLINICGEIVELTRLQVEDELFEPPIISFLDNIITQREIKAIGLGVPGIVSGGSYLRKSKNNTDLYNVELGDTLAKRYGIPVIMENDLNATAIGFVSCYQKQHPAENLENTNMVYLFFENDCVSTGIISDGHIVRGHNNFAGELGLIPIDNDKLLRDYMSNPMDNKQYTHLVTKILVWICGILNPQYIALGGPNFRKDCISQIGNNLSAILPKHMSAEILYAPDLWLDYYAGMAQLTAGKMFDDVQFIKE